jgi:hypothetical protein
MFAERMEWTHTSLLSPKALKLWQPLISIISTYTDTTNLFEIYLHGNHFCICNQSVLINSKSFFKFLPIFLYMFQSYLIKKTLDFCRLYCVSVPKIYNFSTTQYLTYPIRWLLRSTMNDIICMLIVFIFFYFWFLHLL